MKNAIAMRHVAFEDAGILAGLLQERGIALRYLEAGIDDLSPAKDADLLLVLGGPIGIYEVGRYPFLKGELAAIEAAVKKDVPVIGICLGCQALAAVLAARVYPGREKELGWDEMTLTDDGYIWTIPAGPGAIIRFTAHVTATTWQEIGEYVPANGPPIKNFEMNLTKVGDTEWPLGTPISSK